ASKYMIKCMAMGPPWVIYDEWTESLRGLYVVSGLRETFSTSWREHVEWSEKPDEERSAEGGSAAEEGAGKCAGNDGNPSGGGTGAGTGAGKRGRKGKGEGNPGGGGGGAGGTLAEGQPAPETPIEPSSTVDKKKKTPLQLRIVEARTVIAAYSTLSAQTNTLLAAIDRNPNWSGLNPDVLKASAAAMRDKHTNLESKVSEDPLVAQAMFENLATLQKRVPEKDMWSLMQKVLDVKPFLGELESEVQQVMDMSRVKRERDAKAQADAAAAAGGGGDEAGKPPKRKKGK
ncbi:unnamed protein product, partial [Prorocentrum cordatum]